MGDRARAWRWQRARHKVHSRATSYKRTSHGQSGLLARVRAALPSGRGSLGGVSLGFSFPLCKTAYHFPYLQTRK